MQFQTHKILSKKIVQRIAEHILIGKGAEYVELGNVDFSSAPDLVIKLMEEWCVRIDRRINSVRLLTDEPYCELYRRLMYERGFTYSEFCCLFDDKIPESEYMQYPVFEFLLIQSDRQRRRFIIDFDRNVEGYVKLLSQAKPLCWSFFLRELRSIIPVGELKKNAYVSGKLGSGKSEILKSIIYSLQKLSQKQENYSIVVLDPHGDLITELRQFSMNKNSSRLVYIDPFLKEGYFPVFNPLELRDRSEQSIELTTQTLVSAINELMSNSELSTQMTALLAPCIATLLRKGDASLRDLQYFMNDEMNTELVALGKQSPNQSHAFFFHNEFSNKAYSKTKIAIYTRLLDLLNTSAFYNLVTGKSTFDLEQLLNEGKIVLFNLSKGILGPLASSAFGRFLIASIQAIAQRRAIKEKSKRVPTFLFIDEFQNYVTPSISTILTETRKFGLSLIASNQTLTDIPTNIRANILNNTEVKIIGRNGVDTLQPLARNINLKLDKLLEMPKYHFYVKTGDRSPFLFSASDLLVIEKAHAKQYYLTKQEAKEQLTYFWRDSGYYRPLNAPKSKEKPKDDTKDIPDDLKPKFDF